MLLTIFHEIQDPRRAQGRRYDLPHIMLFSVFAVLSGADSYRDIADFISGHFEKLKKEFELSWKRTPSYTTVRDVIQRIDSQELERVFRKYAKKLAKLDSKKYAFIALDGKTLRGSFNNFQDKKAMQVFSAFLSGKNLILAHENIEGRKTNEIPVAQKLVKDLDLKGCVFTMDAMHCQKKL